MVAIKKLLKHPIGKASTAFFTLRYIQKLLSVFFFFGKRKLGHFVKQIPTPIF